MHIYTVYKYQIDWELTPFSFLRGAAFAGGSLSARAVLKRPVVVWRGYVCVTVLNRIGYLAKMLYPGQILKKTRVEQ
jgi:hypothetical protein